MPKRKCTFSDKLAKDYPYFRQGKGENYAFCKVCCCCISIAHKGRLDIEDHIKTEKHKKNYNNQSECGDFILRHSRLIRAAEGALAFHTVRRHKSHRSMDCAAQLNQIMYLDLDMAKEVSCTRSDCEAIVSNVLAPYSLDKIRKDIGRVCYVGVACDSSSLASTKIYPIVVRYFDFRNGGTQTKVLDVRSASDETPDTVSDLVADTLAKASLSQKCAAFTGDNCNTNFHGQRGKNAFAKLQSRINGKLINVGCPAQLINNAFHHGCDSLLLDVEYIILKIFNYFSIYDVRVESLKEFCDFVSSEYQQLLRISRARWLYLFPLSEMVLKFFDVLKVYFLSLENIPSVFEMFFQNEFGEAYLYLIHSLMSVFYSGIRQFERHDNSLVETIRILTDICTTLRDKEDSRFIPLKIRSIFNNARKCGSDIQVYNFTKQILQLYNTSRKYLEAWLQPLEEFRCFQWMNVKEFNSWDWDRDIVPSLTFLNEKGVCIDNAKFFYQLAHLKLYIERLGDDEIKNQTHRIWASFFRSCDLSENYSELLKAAEFFFAIAPHNADVAEIHSLIETYWSNRSDDLSLDTVSGIVMANYNFQDIECADFYEFLLASEDLLNQLD